MVQPPQTALSTSRARFVEGLGDRARELRGAMALLAADPDSAQAKGEMRRRLHALYATAELFDERTMLSAIRKALQGVDAATADARPMGEPEMTLLASLAANLPNLLQAPQDATAPDRQASEAPAPPVSSTGPTAIPVDKTVAGLASPSEQLSVLVLDQEDVQGLVRDWLPESRFEVTGTANVYEALQLLRECSPNVVLIDAELALRSDVDLVRAVHAEALGDVLTIALLVDPASGHDESELERIGARDTLHKPLKRSTLLSFLGGYLGRRRSRSSSALEAVKVATVDDIASRVADEVRRGIADSLQIGRTEPIDITDNTEIMAAAWSAIGRIRSNLVQRSGGRVRFRQSASPAAPNLLALTPEEDDSLEYPTGDLAGRRILVADDDPAVLWFFSGLLRESGAQVIEAKNGKDALELARQRQPDAVISDILMPKVDGFALCRELKRDLLLSHVPVILLSWKEDFLQRMRELDAGASGYLRKEAGGGQVLRCLHGVLGPRSRLERSLQDGSEVRGKVQDTGVLCLLEAVARHSVDARMTVRDAWNYFEVEIRDGHRLAVTRTSTDGTFGRSEGALRQLLGVTSGRFHVVRDKQSIKGAFADPMDVVVGQMARRLGAILDAVSDARLVRVAKISFDEDVLGTMLSATPTHVTDVVAQLRTGETTARDLLVSGRFPAQELESHLMELGRRGAILGVEGLDGEDLVAEAERVRRAQPGHLLHTSEPPKKTSSWPPPAQEDELGSRFSQQELTELGSRPPAPPRFTPEPSVARVDTLPLPASKALPEPVAPIPSSPAVPAEAVALVEHSPTLETDEPASSEPPVTAQAVDLVELAAMRIDRAEQVAREAQVEPDGPRSAQLVERPPIDAVTADPDRRHSTRPPEPPRGLGPIVMAAIVLAVCYFGWVALYLDRPAGVTWQTGAPSRATPTTAQGTRPAGEAPPEPAPVAAPPKAYGDDDAVGFGRLLPFVDNSKGVEVAPDEGLLVVEHTATGSRPRIRVGSRDLGETPVAVALPGGRHELVIRRNGTTSFRFLVIRPGETRVVDLR